MDMRNFTPFPNLRFYGSDSQGRDFGVFVAKGTYAVGADGVLEVAEEQAPLVLADRYHGDPNASSLWLPSDLVPKKPRSDVIVNAVARAPGGRPSPSWLCGIRVEGGARRLEKKLRVTGPRAWEPVHEDDGRGRGRFLGWRLTEPEPVLEVPLRYELAYGGVQRRPGEDGEAVCEADERNPIGRGWIDAGLTPRDAPVPAPQIEDPADPVADPARSHAPQGLGPIPPAWLPRRPLGGTYDARWRAEVWPNWPADYDFAYHNSAHPDLIHPGFLAGDEEIRLIGLDGGARPRVLRLPGHRLELALDLAEGGSVRFTMDLDTLLLDIADPDPAEYRIFLTWRATFAASGVTGLALSVRPAREPDGEAAAGSDTRVEAMEA